MIIQLVTPKLFQIRQTPGLSTFAPACNELYIASAFASASATAAGIASKRLEMNMPLYRLPCSSWRKMVQVQEALSSPKQAVIYPMFQSQLKQLFADPTGVNSLQYSIVANSVHRISRVSKGFEQEQRPLPLTALLARADGRIVGDGTRFQQGLAHGIN